MGPKFVFVSFIFREKDGLGQGHIKKKKAGSTACNNNYVHIESMGLLPESQNHFLEPNRQLLTFFSSNYTVQDHILSTTGDAVREHLYFTQEPITMINQSITIKFFWLII
jgi:hypothetical protein